MKVKIKSIDEVDSRGNVHVSLYGMSADLSQNIIINPRIIPNYFGVGKSGYSVERRIRAGEKLECDSIHHATRVMENPRFVE